MKDILLTSSVLVLALLVLRQIFRKSISRRLQYALWALVLLRLLVPVSLPALDFNVLTASEPAVETVSHRLEQQTVYVLPTGQVDLPEESRRNPELQPGYVMAPTSTGIMVVDEGGETATVYAGWLTAGELLRGVWYAGIAVMACWFLASNLRFWRKLRKARTLYPVEGCKYPVYLVESGLPSPCLFGLFRPAIYLTPAAVSSPERLRHVIAHETTHARHLDPLWSVLRCVCLAVYWFDPLVWAAAIVSKTDCELACDEGALKCLDDGERIPYGQTLLSLIPVRRGPGSPLLTATTMTSGKRRLKDRITRIAENRQTVTAALFLVIALAAVVCAATFTGAKERDIPLTQEELDDFNEEFFNEFSPIRSQFLTSLYEKPEDIDMYALFYNGTGLPGVASQEERQKVVDTFYDGFDPEVDLIKLPAADVDAVLKEYTGLTLADTQALGMGGFNYLAEYDAYYHFHGDIITASDITFTVGERAGDTIRLYYHNGSFGAGEAGCWKCVTLREISGEAAEFPYHIVSHTLCDRPDHLLPEVQALTGDELAYFNEEFFNNNTDIRNQFLTSLYKKPEDIDLYELFYCGTGVGAAMTEEERQLVCAFDENGEEICPTDKLPVSAMDEVLLASTGLNLMETRQIGLENFTYLEQYDAYYHTHGDTNYRANVIISAGEREGGTIRLYYADNDARYPDCDWLCVTLAEQTDGTYWFVSNLPCEKPTIGTVYPEGEPVLTIPLAELEPYKPEAVTVEHHTDDCAERGGGWSISAEDGSDISVRSYLSTDGNLYAAIVYDEAAGRDGMLTWNVGCFFTFPENNSIADGESTVDTFFFSDLFGHSGWQVSYRGQLSEHHWTTFTDYYYFEDGQTPILLARTHGLNNQIVDLDGDGQNELINEDNQLFFQRDGELYQADITVLLQERWPEMVWWDYSILDPSRRCLTVKGFVEMAEWGEDAQADFLRDIYFDGENLLVYGNLVDTEDHVAVNIPGTVPEQVLETGKAQAQMAFEATKQGDDGALTDYHFDDWRVSYLSLAGTYTDFGLTVEVYSLGYQFHAAEPGEIMLAGGMYIQEDGWVGGFYVEESPYLVYQVREDGTRKQLISYIAGDCSVDSPIYRQGCCRTLLKSGLIQPSDMEGKDLALLCYSGVQFFNDMGEYSPSTQAEAFRRLASFQAAASEEDAYYVNDALQNLEWNSSGLTDEGRDAYSRLLAALDEAAALSGEELLAQFTANPAAFLRSTAELDESARAEVCQSLAYYYDGGTSAQKARFSDALHSVTQPGLGADDTAVYELLRASCALPGPAERTADDEAAILEAVQVRLNRWGQTEGCLSLRPVQVEIDEKETARVVQMYTASLLANASGWTDDYTSRMVVVRAVYDAYYDFSRLKGDLEHENGLNAWNFYLLPNQNTGEWEIWDGMGTRVPEDIQSEWQAQQLPQKTFTKSDVEFSGRALDVQTDPMTYEERLAWCQTTEFSGSFDYISAGQYTEAGGAIACVGQWIGTPHVNQYGLSLRFSDGTLAGLPLPDDSVMSIAPPGSMEFLDGVFVYRIYFPTQEITNDNQTLIHLKGTYLYEVDLAAKTVSLTVLDN